MNHVVMDRDVCESRDSVSPRVAEELYPLAVKQARSQVVIQVLVLLALATTGAAVGSPQSVWLAVGLIASGVVATTVDIRWWLWLRRANPLDAYEQLQLREDSHTAAGRSPFTLFLNVIVAVLWLLTAG